MAEQFNQQLRQQFDSTLNPLRKGVPWQQLIVQGAVLAVVGVFAFLVPATFTDLLGALIGAYLLLISFLNIRAELRTAAAGGVLQPFRLIRGGIGLVIGVIAIVQLFVTTLDRAGAFTVLVIGLVMYSVIGLIGIFVRKQGFHVGEIVGTALPLVLGGLLAYSLITGESIIGVIAAIFLIAGVLLLVYGFIVYRQTQAAGAAPPPSAPPAAPPPTAAI
jgi:uncharacterized membrane protein HdeD (DUF308 family)